LALWVAKAARNGKKWQRNGKAGGKNGKVWWGCGHLQAIMLTAAIQCQWQIRHDMGLFKVLAAYGGAL